MEKGLGSIVLRNTFGNQHFFHVFCKIEYQLNIFFIFTDAVVVVHIETQLVAITNDLFPALSKCLNHMGARCNIYVGPKTELSAVLPFANSVLSTIFTSRTVSPVFFTSSRRHLFSETSLDISGVRAPKTFVHCPLANLTEIGRIV